MNNADKLSRNITYASGSSLSLLVALFLIIIWIAGGFFFGFNEIYQLIANTFTTLVTFAMVFAIQNSQNRDTAAIQAKLDELVAATQGARNKLVGIEKRENENGVENERLTPEDCNGGEKDE